jgi:hypothetical protein
VAADGHDTRVRKLAFILCATLVCGLAHSQTVYRVVQPDGTVEFTDNPPPGQAAQAIDVPPLNTVPLAGSPRDAFEEPPRQQSKPIYEHVTITQPEQNGSLWGTGGQVKVDVEARPSLRPGDRVDLVMDGVSVGGGRSTAFTLEQVDRGTHVLQAVIKDSAGKVMAQSNSVTFTIHQAAQRRLPTN